MAAQPRKRTSKQQFSIYLSYLEENEILRSGKLTPSDPPDKVNRLWENLAEVLNSCGDGPIRSVPEWRKVFIEWRSAIRKKARESKSLSDIEKKLIDLTGKVAVTGIGCPELGLGAPSTSKAEEDIIIQICNMDDAVDNSEVSYGIPISPVETPLPSVSDVPAESSLQEPKSKKKSRSAKITYPQYELYLNFLKEGSTNFNKLVEELNRCPNSPIKSNLKWQKAFWDWKCSVKRKAREIYIYQHETGGGLPTEKKISNLEATLLQLLGKLCVVGMNVLELGLVKQKTLAKKKKPPAAQKSPTKKVSPLRRSSPVNKPSSFKTKSPINKPNAKMKSTSPRKSQIRSDFGVVLPDITNKTNILINPAQRRETYTLKFKDIPSIVIDSPQRRDTYSVRDKENFIHPNQLSQFSNNENFFISPVNTTFHLRGDNCIERRQTYSVCTVQELNISNKSQDSHFSDSLEMTSPEDKSHIVITQKSKNDLEEHSQFSINDKFKAKLQTVSFAFSPVTPHKFDTFNPNTFSSEEKSFVFPHKVERDSAISLFPEKNNRTFDVELGSPVDERNISTGTYTKGNCTAETYVKGNISRETYTKGNTSWESCAKANVSTSTYIKDNSIGDLTNLSVSPISSKTRCISPEFLQPNPVEVHRFSSKLNTINFDNVKNENYLIAAKHKNQQLYAIQEESYVRRSDSENESYNNSTQNFLKRKSDAIVHFAPPKRPNLVQPSNKSANLKDWSKTSGVPFRVAKSASGLNIQHFISKNQNNKTEKQTIVTKKDTNTVIVSNPFLMAATHMVDPFMSSDVYCDGEWMEEQENYFKKWLNALLTPPAELNTRSDGNPLDVAKVWQECKRREVEAPPTKELLSSKYHTSHRLNLLRKAAQNLFMSVEMGKVFSKVALAIEAHKLVIREDRDIHLNLALKSDIISLILSYNPLWLRIGLETVYNEVLPLQSNSDVVGLSTFILERLFKDPYSLRKYKTVHSPKYILEFKKFFLKKFFILVYFLDQAKQRKLIAHDPCLFCKNSSVKDSREVLIRFARDTLAAVGDITKFLKLCGYVVSYKQTYIHEFDYAVTCLGGDLRDGVRLTRVMEIILLRDDLVSNLRVPAISRLQKVHNMKIVFDSLERAGYQILYDITPKDIVDGHKEKTLSFLWQIIYKFQAPLMVKSATTIQNWWRSPRVMLIRKRLGQERQRKINSVEKIQMWYKRQKIAQDILCFAAHLKNYLHRLRKARAATKILSYYRMYKLRNNYMILRTAVVGIQKYAKSWLVRNYYKRRIKAAVVIQSHVRKFLARKRYLQVKKAASIIQQRYLGYKHTKLVKNSYVKLKKAAVLVQTKYRAIKLMRIHRSEYLKYKTSAKKIGVWYSSILLMRTCRSQFLMLKKSVQIVESRYLAIKQMSVEFSRFNTLKRYSILIQRRYRAMQAMRIQHKAFAELRQWVIFVQQKFIASRLMKRERSNYLALKSATLTIQTRFRANMAMKLERKKFLRLKSATISTQVCYRALVVMKSCRSYYLKLKHSVQIFEKYYQAKRKMEIDKLHYRNIKHATLLLQRRYRAVLEMRKTRIEYCRLKEATIFVQRRFTANKLCKEQRKNYLKIRKAALVVQQHYRAYKSMKTERAEYVLLQKSVMMLQQRFRVNILMKNTKQEYQRLRNATILIQHRYRAQKLMKSQGFEYLKLKKATVTLQQHYRAKVSMLKAMNNFQALKNACCVIQQRYRAQISMRKQQKSYIKLRTCCVIIQRLYRAKLAMRIQRNNYRTLKKATVVIQRQYRARLLLKKEFQAYQSIRTATQCIQQRFRAYKCMKLQRQEYLMLREAVTVLQRRYRALVSMRTQQTYYRTLKKAAVTTQRLFRAQIAMRLESRNYQKLRNATLTFQQRYRAQQCMKVQRSRFIALRKAALVIQRLYRANVAMKSDRNRYEALKKASLVLQQRYRANVCMKREYARYQEIKTAAIKIQQFYRACRSMKVQISEFLAIKRATIYIQQSYRANCAMKLARNNYIALKKATVLFQRHYRAQIQMRLESRNYKVILKSIVTIQQRYRAHKSKELEKSRYGALKKATIFIQRLYRANVVMKRESRRFITLKTACVLIQRKFRAQKAMKLQRSNYLRLKKYTIIVQQRYRAHKLMQIELVKFQILRKTTVFVQRKYRAKLAMEKARTHFLALRKFTVLLQQRFRARVEMHRCSANYTNLRNHVIIIQQRFRAQVAMKRNYHKYQSLKKAAVVFQQVFRANRSMKIQRNNFQVLRQAAVTIQQKYRAIVLKQADQGRYKKIKQATTKIQWWFKATVAMKRERIKFLKIKGAVITIQQHYRAKVLMNMARKNYLMKRTVCIFLQKYIRGYLIRKKHAEYLSNESKEQRRRLRVETAAVTKIQALWRGHRSRSIDSPQLVDIRKRTKIANANAIPQNTLGYRCKQAIELLISDNPTVSQIIRVLEDLEFITRRCRETCMKLSTIIPTQLYIFISSAIRSLPEMKACTIATYILINFCKYPVTKPTSWIPEYINAIVTVMLHWCDKEAPLFPALCTLLWLFAHTEEYRSVILELPNVQHRFLKIRGLCERKQKMVSRVGVKGVSPFAPYTKLPLPSLNPDWGLEFKTRPRAFSNSMHALIHLMKILDM